MASGYFKKLPLNSPTDFFFPVLFLSSNGQVRVCWLLENPGDFEKENLWWFMVKMELCTLIFYTKRMLVSPYQAGIYLKACLVVETIHTLISEGLKVPCASLGTRSPISVRDVVWSYGIIFFFHCESDCVLGFFGHAS